MSQLVKQKTSKKIDMEDPGKYGHDFNVHELRFPFAASHVGLCQANAGHPRCSAAPGGDGRSSGPFVWNHAGRLAQPQRAHQGAHTRP